ncbi:MAG: M23 family metallopeptidase [Crocinitomix sp.]|nr:M23 family metallopeptidase [Crocinitomix sp.]
MKKQKFRYNPVTLSYDKVEVSWREKLLRVILVAAPAIVLGFLFYLLFSTLFKSTREKNLEIEYANVSAQITQMNEDYALAERVLTDLQKRDDEIYRVVFNAEPFPENLRQMGTGGGDDFAHLEGTQFSDRLIELNKRLKEIEKKIYAQSISFDEVIALAKEKEKMLACIPAIQPVSNKDLNQISSGFGMRIDPIYKTARMHWGLDFTADEGTNVYSTGNGVVKDLEQNAWGYGNCVLIDHGFGYVSRYAHLSAFKVKKGDKITRGQLIGLVGSTGKSTAPHLHYEIEKNGVKIDPIHFFHSDISPAEYEKLLQMAKNANQSFD